MSIIEHTTKLQLTLFKGSSINPAILEYYSADMQKIDDAFTRADERLSALETSSEEYAGRLTSLETWKDETVDPTLGDYGTRIENIESIIATVSTANIDALTERVNALEEKVEANSQHIITINGEINAINDSISAIQTLDNAQNSRLNTLENQVVTLENCCEEVRSTLADHNGRINQNASDIAALDVRVTANEGNIAANAQDITILANQVRVNSEKINQILDDIPVQDIINAVNRITALETLCGDEELETTAQTLSGAINELHDDNVDLQSAIGNLNTQIAEAQVDISNLETSVQTIGSNLGGLAEDVHSLIGLPTMVENLNTRVGTVETSVAGVSNRIDALDAVVGDSSNGLVKDVADNTSAISDIQTLETGANVSATNNGLVYSFTKRGNVCKVIITGTLESAVSDADVVQNIVPNGYSAYGNVFTAASARKDVNNSLLSFEIDGGDIVVHSGAGNLAVGTVIYQEGVYMINVS